MFHVDINKLHVNIDMLHVDIMYLLCRGGGAEVCHHTFLAPEAVIFPRKIKLKYIARSMKKWVYIIYKCF